MSTTHFWVICKQHSSPYLTHDMRTPRAFDNVQAILDLEIALVSSSQSTIASTTSIDQDAIVSGNATSSWLRGFINWLPSSSYASSSEEYKSGNEQGLWVGSADLFHDAVNDFLAEPEYQRYEMPLMFCVYSSFLSNSVFPFSSHVLPGDIEDVQISFMIRLRGRRTP